MTWFGPDVADRIQAALAHVHEQFAETVFVRRPQVDGSADGVYLEDLTKTEDEFRVLATVQQNPAARTLLKFGQKQPVDLLLTFAHLHLVNAGLPDGPVTGDSILWRGQRYTVVKTNDKIKAVTRPEEFDDAGNPVADQYAETFSFWALAVISTSLRTEDTNVPGVAAPTVENALIHLTQLNTVLVTLSENCYGAGVPMRSLRVKQDGVIVRQTSVAVAGTLLTIVLESPITVGQAITFSYNPVGVRPIEDGIASTTTDTELEAVTDYLVNQVA